MKSHPSFPFYLIAFAASCAAPLHAQLGPEVTSWRTNLNGAKGASNNATIHAAVSVVDADVRSVQYDATDVYVTVTQVPSYSVGPFPGNPGVPGDTGAIFRITRNPTVATNKTATGLGSIVVFVNGVPGYNALDGRSYFNLGIWNQNAMVVEGPGLDAALGHPSPGRGGPDQYHHHSMPISLLGQEGETWGAEHSPLIGYSFDGYPVYGPYGYANVNGSGGITRIRSSYRLRSITVREVLPNGTQLSANEYGPVVSTQYPLGFFIEDFEYVSGLGELDEHNGRFCVTPEYPNGTYAYFATVDANHEPEYPFIVGPTYYGVVIDNRRVTIPAGVTAYEEQTQRTGGRCGTLDLEAQGLPTVPNSSFAVTLADGPASAGAVYLIGDGLLPDPDTLFGCPIYLDLTSIVHAAGMVTLDASGAHSLALPIPNDPTLVGVSADLQSAATDGPGVTTSNALTLLLK